MNATTFTYQAATDLLVTEGYDRDDVTALLDSVINAGLELDQPDEGTLFSADELDTVREELNSTGVGR